MDKEEALIGVKKRKKKRHTVKDKILKHLKKHNRFSKYSQLAIKVNASRQYTYKMCLSLMRSKQLVRTRSCRHYYYGFRKD